MTAPHLPTLTKRERLESATYRIPQVAEMMQVSERHVWRMIDVRAIPGVIRLGRTVRVSKSIFDTFLSEGGAR